MVSDRTLYQKADRRIPSRGDFLDAAVARGLTPEELTRRIRALQPFIADHAEEAEAMRRPVDAVWQALRDAGFFYQFVPKRFGGIETNFDAFIDAGMAIAEVDPATAWSATFCAEHNWVLTRFPLETQHDLWGGRFPYMIAPLVAFPPGSATPVPGGYRVSAHWKWASGVMHADWIMGTVLHKEEGKTRQALTVLFPARDAEVLDTWFMTGMSGTGSNDVVVKDLFVPAAYTVSNLLAGPCDLTRREHENPIYRAPIIPFLTMSASIPVVGAAKGMVDAYRQRIAAFARPDSETKLAEKVGTQIRLARADLLARNSELLIRDAGRRMLQTEHLQEPQFTNEKLALRAQLTLAVTNCRDVAFVLAEGAGTSVYAVDQPFQRAMRDSIVGSTHVLFDFDTTYEQHGRGLLGLPPTTPLN